MKLHRYVAGLFGYELIKKRKLNDTLAQHLANVIDEQAIDLVIDVGANAGQFALSLRLHGYSGRIASFEPLTDAYGELVKRSESDHTWLAFKLALGSSSQPAIINTHAASEFSSLLTANKYAHERFRWRARTTGTQEVAMQTLENMWPEVAYNMENPRALLKLDTQGYDLEVLAGSGSMLDHVRAVQVEVSLKPIYDGAPHYLQVLDEFERLGFEVTGLYPVSRDKQSLAIIEYDCVMTRARQFGAPAA